MALLSSQGPDVCPKCGKDWLGRAKCECGWRPDAGMHNLKIAGSVLAVAFVAAGCYFVPHWYEYFPNNAEADEHAAKANAELNAHNGAGAIREYYDALQYSPNRADLHRKLADALFSEQNNEEALKQCEIAYKLAPHDKEVVESYAGILGIRGEWKHGAQVLESFYTANPKNATDKVKLASYYQNAEDFDRAESLYKQVTEQEPKVGNIPWLKLYELYSHKNDKKTGIETLRAALHHLPNDALLQETLGIALLENGQPKEAVPELKRATQLEPSLAQRNAAMISSAGGSKPAAK